MTNDIEVFYVFSKLQYYVFVVKLVHCNCRDFNNTVAKTVKSEEIFGGEGKAMFLTSLKISKAIFS